MPGTIHETWKSIRKTLDKRHTARGRAGRASLLGDIRGSGGGDSSDEDGHRGSNEESDLGEHGSSERKLVSGLFW